MKQKKYKSIITCFENLDFDNLLVLLDPVVLIQGCNQAVFINRIKDYCDKFSLWEGGPYQCYNAHKPYPIYNKSGYSFVNNEGYCYLSIDFTEENEQLVSINQNWNIEPKQIAIENSNDMHIVYLDDKANFEISNDYLNKKVVCSKFLQVMQEKLSEDGFLKMEFASAIYEEYKDFFDLDDYINGNIFSFQEEFARIFWSVQMLVEIYREEPKSKELYLEFLTLNVVTDNVVKIWLKKAFRAFRHYTFDFCYKVDYRQRIIYEQGFRYDFDEFFWSHAIKAISKKYHYLSDGVLFIQGDLSEETISEDGCAFLF